MRPDHPLAPEPAAPKPPPVTQPPEKMAGCVCDPEMGKVCLFHFDLDAVIISRALENPQ